MVSSRDSHIIELWLERQGVLCPNRRATNEPEAKSYRASVIAISGCLAGNVQDEFSPFLHPSGVRKTYVCRTVNAWQVRGCICATTASGSWECFPNTPAGVNEPWTWHPGSICNSRRSDSRRLTAQARQRGAGRQYRVWLSIGGRRGPYRAGPHRANGSRRNSQAAIGRS
jgi:hypothetical protein